MSKYIIGSISTGTLRPQDLIETFANALKDLSERQGTDAHYRQLADEALTRRVDPASDDAADLLDQLQEGLYEHAPPYFYFGSSEGDASDFGFWLSEPDEFDGLRVDDLSEVPPDHTGEVLLTNGHGNLSLYYYNNGSGEEVWSVV